MQLKYLKLIATQFDSEIITFPKLNYLLDTHYL